MVKCAYLGCNREGKYRGLYGWYCEGHIELARSFNEEIQKRNLFSFIEL